VFICFCICNSTGSAAEENSECRRYKTSTI